MKYIDADKLKTIIKLQINERKEWLKDIDRSDRQDQLWSDLNGEDMSILQIINSLQQEQKEEPDKDLEEAAEDCVWKSIDNNDPTLVPKFIPLLLSLFISGAYWQKEQMLKEAVEGEVYLYHSYNRDATAILVDIPKENLGDKVHIIVLPKEDDK